MVYMLSSAGPPGGALLCFALPGDTDLSQTAMASDRMWGVRYSCSVGRFVCVWYVG